MSDNFERQLDSPSPPVPPMLVGTLEAARLLGIGRTLFCELVRAGDVASKRIGNRRLFRIADLEEFVDSLPDAYIENDERGGRRILRRALPRRRLGR